MTTSTTSDIINSLAGIDADSPLAGLRAQRPESMLHAQGSYTALFDPSNSAGPSQLERLRVALRVAEAHASLPAIAHFKARLEHGGAGSQPSPRLRAMLRHADLLTSHPARATPDDLQALADAGLSTRDIVTLSQVIAFMSFFVRVIAALQALGAEPPPSAAHLGNSELAPEPIRAAQPAQIRRPEADLRRPTAFTVEQLAWVPWLEPLELARAEPIQLAALDGQRASSPYFRLLALDPEVLIERTRTDLGIFYTHAGAPRADRELAAAATSRWNGCIYCTSVHAARAAQLSKRERDIERMLQQGVDPGTPLELDARWQAIVDAAVALAKTPPALSRAHVATLHATGLQNLETLDVLQSGAFFAWANRLMLSLGEPVRYE